MTTESDVDRIAFILNDVRCDSDRERAEAVLALLGDRLLPEGFTFGARTFPALNGSDAVRYTVRRHGEVLMESIWDSLHQPGLAGADV